MSVKKGFTVMLVSVLVLSMSLSVGTGYGASQVKGSFVTEESAPIDRDTVVDTLMQKGTLSKTSSQAEISTALQTYAGKIETRNATKYDKMRAGVLEQKIESGLQAASAFQGNKLGQKTSVEPATSVAYPEPQKTVKVLVILADFLDYTHNNIAEPNLKQVYWTKDFSPEHYQQLLFGDGYYTTPEGIKSPTFKQYFKEQSNGNLDVEGAVVGWYQVSKDAAYYGANNKTSNNIHAKDFVLEATEAAVKSGIDLVDYDIEDPYDLDGDGDLNEKDGIVDHLMVIHPGLGEEQGGGTLGEEAIWSHSASVGAEPITVAGADAAILPYTTEPENGAVGVFTHEFTHDLGMPDDYDTIYSADGDIVEYWSLMASGSWSGAPGGTMPSGINPYSRIILGLIHGGKWINWKGSTLDSLSTGKVQLDTATMNTGNTQALVVKLPSENNTMKINTPATGSFEFYGGTGPEIDNSMTATLDLTGKSQVNLAYNIWYNIEENWDGGFVQVSKDGTDWTSLATTHTVLDFNNPEGYSTIVGSLPGYTGNSNGWIKESINLSSYAGKQIYLRFRYATDWGTELEGMFVDDISVTADGSTIFSDGAENGLDQFTNDGWETFSGTKTGPHYYVAEWRSHLGVDEGLGHNAKADVAYNQGMLLWYVNGLYNDNWVGAHPGYGQLGVVDSTQYTYLNAGLGNGNENGLRAGYMPFVQMHDAAFSLDKAANMDLSIYSWAKNPNLKAKQAEPTFDDSNSYFSVKSPYSGLKLPKLGLKIRVTGNATDYSRGELLISK